ncbi:MAG: hypothetical protein JKY67_00300 [Pseudomonadales bacterium]|nr:hypothetical protein [Pseudomonadales bacterium]
MMKAETAKLIHKETKEVLCEIKLSISVSRDAITKHLKQEEKYIGEGDVEETYRLSVHLDNYRYISAVAGDYAEKNSVSRDLIRSEYSWGGWR